MSSILTSQGVVFATAMAVSGTVILLALRLQKSFPASQFSPITAQSPPPLPPRPCISSSDGKKKEKKKKRVQFAEDVMDPVGNSEEFRKQHSNSNSNSNSNRNGNGLSSNSSSKNRESGKQIRGMPENRVALYNGILRDRLVHRRLAYSY